MTRLLFLVGVAIVAIPRQVQCETVLPDLTPIAMVRCQLNNDDQLKLQEIDNKLNKLNEIVFKLVNDLAPIIAKESKPEEQATAQNAQVPQQPKGQTSPVQVNIQRVESFNQNNYYGSVGNVTSVPASTEVNLTVPALAASTTTVSTPKALESIETEVPEKRGLPSAESNKGSLSLNPWNIKDSDVNLTPFRFKPNNFQQNHWIKTVCEMKPNRRIALLNQQDIEGTIQMWQVTNPAFVLPPKHSWESVYMRIRLRGFKVQSKSAAVNDQANGQTTLEAKGVQQPADNGTNQLSLLDDDHTHLFYTPAAYNGNASSGNGNDRDHRLLYAMKVHESGDMSRDCQTTGNAYKPDPFLDIVPNLGNIVVDHNGRVDMNWLLEGVELSGPLSIVNRSIVVRLSLEIFPKLDHSPFCLDSQRFGPERSSTRLLSNCGIGF